MSPPVTTGLAMSTLRLLAHHQGARADDVTAEEPGKILHEVRSAGFSLGEDDGADRHLPPAYYGTIDATPLWALTLHDAWSWGPRRGGRGVAAGPRRALTWQVERGDSTATCSSIRRPVRPRSVQPGWKDSGDAVRRRDGWRAASPLALAEVRGILATAARGADLFDRSGPGADRGGWAELYVPNSRGAYGSRTPGTLPRDRARPGQAPIISLTSNIGRLLGTGILDADGVDIIAPRHRLVPTSSLAGASGPCRRRPPASRRTATTLARSDRATTRSASAQLAAGARAETTTKSPRQLLAAHAAFNSQPPQFFAATPRGKQPLPAALPRPACRPQGLVRPPRRCSLVGSVLGLRPDGDVVVGRARCSPGRSERPASPGSAPTVDPWTSRSRPTARGPSPRADPPPDEPAPRGVGRWKPARRHSTYIPGRTDRRGLMRRNHDDDS